MKNLYTKLLSIQNELGAIKKAETARVPTKSGGSYDYKFFDINALIPFIKPLLEKHKLVLIQPLTSIEGKGAIRTILFDTESGESIEDVTPLTYNEDPQKMGSAVTYFRRYAIQSLFLLEAEDDDGNGASLPPKAQAQKPQAQKVTPSTPPKVSTFILDGYEYVTGQKKNGSGAWYSKQPVGTRDGTYIQAFEYDSAYSQYKANQI